jgi:hypothetical protein
MASKTWIGGGNNQASNAADWSPTGAPRGGDSLSMESGTLYVAGNSVLHGDTLTLDGQYGQSATVNLNGNTNLTLAANMLLSNATISGGKVLVSTINLHGSSLTLHDDVVGGGTISLLNQQSGGFSTMTLDGSVSRLKFIEGTFMPDGTSARPPNQLTIDHPNEFHGSVQLFNGTVTLDGLHASSYDLHNSVLALYQGAKVVDRVNLQNSSGLPLQVAQIGSAVAISASFSDLGGTTIPVHS